MDIQAYFDRIGFSGSRQPTLGTLQKLMSAHLRRIPFENLSIHIGERIRLDEDWLFEKIVHRNRGGFCYELNGLFGGLLNSLGYDVSMLSARVKSSNSPDGTFGPEFDHMILKVELDEPWLVDVGFGRAFTSPLHLRVDEIQQQGPEEFKLTRDGEMYTYWRLDRDWIAEYQFTLNPHAMESFSKMCHYHQTSSQSPFTRNWMATRLSRRGRETLHQDGDDFRYITTDANGRHEVIIQGLENAVIMLEDIFGIPESTFERPGQRKQNRREKRK